MALRSICLTSTQVGSIGESVTACGLMLASRGRLSPYRPLADDDGVDLLLVDKQTREIVQLQIKCRTSFDNEAARTVQFDVQFTTFALNAKGYVLGIVLDGAKLVTGWLIPISELPKLARSTSKKLIVVASAKTTSRDKFSSFRHADFESIAAALLAGS